MTNFHFLSPNSKPPESAVYAQKTEISIDIKSECVKVADMKNVYICFQI